MKTITALFIVLVIFTGCKKVDSESNLKEADYIEHGTSFGMCIGYCKQFSVLTSEKITCTKSAWVQNDTLKPVTTSKNIKIEDWNDLLSKIDFESFLKLDSVYGCPDCADGGAEWIEIKSGEKTHKVTFEYRKEPGELKNYIKVLREMNCNQ